MELPSFHFLIFFFRKAGPFLCTTFQLALKLWIIFYTATAIALGY